MEELCYSALDLATIISGMGLGCQSTANFLELVWEGERPFLQGCYREKRKQLILDTNYWLTYLQDKTTIDAEFPVVQQEALALGNRLSEKTYLSDNSSLDLFFKNVRLRILFGGGKDYVMVKRRTLMARYGYKKITPTLIEHFNRCLYFYHLQTYIRKGVPCQIEKIGIDKMVVFRIV